MKKLAFVFLVVLQSAFALTVKDNVIVDSMNNKIEKKEYSKIVVLDPGAVEILYLLGAENNIAAISNTTMNPIWPEDKTKLLPTVGSFNKPSIEKLLSFTPDLVILNSMNSSFGELLKTNNIPFILNGASNINQILSNTEIFGIISGKEEDSKSLVAEYRNRFEKIKSDISKKPLNLSGAFLYSTSPLMAFNSKTLSGEILSVLGIRNLTDNLPGGRPILSPEFVLKENPDILLGAMSIKKKEDVLNSNPMIAHTTAGKNGNIFIVDSNKILRGTPRIIDTLEELHQELSNVK